jgi:hypothetical protein
MAWMSPVACTLSSCMEINLQTAREGQQAAIGIQMSS